MEIKEKLFILKKSHKHRIPSKGTFFENAVQTKKRRLLASGLLAYMIQNKVRTFILEEQINNS